MGMGVDGRGLGRPMSGSVLMIGKGGNAKNEHHTDGLLKQKSQVRNFVLSSLSPAKVKSLL